MSEPCPGCGGTLKVHTAPCPVFTPRKTVYPRIQVVTPAQYVANFQRIYARLAADAHDHGLDGLAIHDWPRNDDLVITQDVTIREQLVCLLGRVLRWAHEDETEDLAQPLLERIRDQLRPAFIAPAAPPLAISPPPWIRVAIQRLHALTPSDAALATPQPGDTPVTSCDRWRVGLWAAELELS